VKCLFADSRVPDSQGQNKKAGVPLSHSLGNEKWDSLNPPRRGRRAKVLFSPPRPVLHLSRSCPGGTVMGHLTGSQIWETLQSSRTIVAFCFQSLRVWSPLVSVRTISKCFVFYQGKRFVYPLANPVFFPVSDRCPLWHTHAVLLRFSSLPRRSDLRAHLPLIRARSTPHLRMVIVNHSGGNAALKKQSRVPWHPP
jgi:hypothetical protein